MGYSNDGSDDLEKLRRAFAEITTKFGSIDDILAAFGLADMPLAQRYGILFGFIVFACTITTVIALLTFGGTFKRIAEQAQTGDATLLTAHDARAQRALLLEELLDSRERMRGNYPPAPRTEGLTNLTKMLLNVSPDSNVEDIGVEDGKENKKGDGKRYVPAHYEQNYLKAYQKCQDRPGGPALSGRPEARFEAYARGFAGCGVYTSMAYRRSYARLYEALACANHAADDKYAALFKTRPHDLTGKYVRLEALQVDRHLADLYHTTSGEPALGNSQYDPEEIWSFQESGPFATEKELRQSFVFQHKLNDAAFAILNTVTDKILGAVLLVGDDPTNLTIQLEAPLMQPSCDGGPEQLEACFLLLDRLFAYGYRRIQFSIDSQDAIKRKLANRLGFTLEGVLYKHMIIKDSSRDSNIYGILNSDWKKGARAALFKKLYGTAALRADTANEKREEEYDEQQRVLAEKKRLEAEASKKKL